MGLSLLGDLRPSKLLQGGVVTYRQVYVVEVLGVPPGQSNNINQVILVLVNLPFHPQPLMRRNAHKAKQGRVKAMKKASEVKDQRLAEPFTIL